MTDLFIKLLNMSIVAGWLVIVVLLLRLALRKAPRWIFCVLWAFVALRLLIPFSVQSKTSAVPSVETVPPEIVVMETAPLLRAVSIRPTVPPILFWVWKKRNLRNLKSGSRKNSVQIC